MTTSNKRGFPAYRKRLGVAALAERFNKDPQTIRRWSTPGQPGYCKFPEPHYLGQDREWFEDEVDVWEAKRMAETAEERGGK